MNALVQCHVMKYEEPIHFREFEHGNQIVEWKWIQ